MKANLTHMKPVPVAEIGAHTVLLAPTYLFLPRNQRMVLLRAAGTQLGEGLYQALQENNISELWSPPTATPAEAAVAPQNTQLLENPLSLFFESAGATPFSSDGEIASRLRDDVNTLCKSTAGTDPHIAEAIEFRSSRDPNAHSVVVGNLAAALAIAEGHPETLGDLLLAATYHDLGLALGQPDHGAAGKALLAESKLELPEAVLVAISRHHETGPHPAGSPLRYLSLAERFTELRAKEPQLKMRELFDKFAEMLPPEDAPLFRRII